MTALALTPPPARHTPEPVADDLFVMLALWRAGTPQCRDVALDIARNNYLASRKEAADVRR